MTSKLVFSVTFFTILLLLMWLLGIILSPFFYPILWALILATTFYPLYTKFLKRLHNRRHVTAAIMTFMVLAIAVVEHISNVFRDQ